MLKKLRILVVILIAGTALSQDHAQAQTQASKKSQARLFWEQLQNHCGNAYEGQLAEGISGPEFEGKRLLMHVRSCEPNRIRIPFVVGDDLSRTWVLTFDNDRITLKHDHRLDDGSEDEVTQYGGTTTNQGFSHLQFFPADPETAQRIDYASANVWWFTIDEDTQTITYNLRRIGTDRLFTVIFDTSQTVDAPPAPWGWEDE